MKPKVTIVIASYNSGKTIKRALQSVEDQTFQDWECLVVDGASKDDTIKIVKEFVDSDSRFRIISEPDDGIYDAFNKGWRNSKGEWIYYLGSDDWLEVDGLEKLLTEEDCDSAILSGDIIYRRLDGTEKLHQSDMPALGSHQGMVTRRTIIEIMGGFNEKYKIHADHELIIRILNAGYKMKLVHVVVAHFIIGGTSQNLKTIFISSREKYEIYKSFDALKYPRITAILSSLKKLLSLMMRGVRSKTN